MNEIFGVPMNSIMAVLLVMLGICLLVVLWIAWRRTLLFKMGLRNVPRRPAQTVLVIIGLMLSTLIIAAAFGTGDTIDNSVTSLTYKTLGPVDELVLYSNSEDGEATLNGGENQTIPADTVQRIDQLFEGTGLIHATMPMLWEEVPVFLFDGDAPTSAQEMLAAAQDGRILQAEPSANLLGIDPAQVEKFGGLTSVDGVGDRSRHRRRRADRHQRVDGGQARRRGRVESSASATTTCRCRPSVVAIAQDSMLSGETGGTTPGMVMPLEQLQAITGKDDDQHGRDLEHRHNVRQPRQRRRNRRHAESRVRRRADRRQCDQAGHARSGRAGIERVHVALRRLRALLDRRRHSADHPDLLDAGGRAALGNGHGPRGWRAARPAGAAIPERRNDLRAARRTWSARCWALARPT